MSVPNGRPAGIDALITTLAKHTAVDVELFLEPWLAHDRVPSVDAFLDGRNLVVRQAGRAFLLPLEIELQGPTDTLRTVVDLDGPEATIALPGAARTYTRAIVDPDHRYLIKRHFGETVRFEVEVPSAGDVLLRGDFAPGGLPANRTAAGVWQVEVPLTEGLYVYHWVVDGKALADEGGDTRWLTRRVRPLNRLVRPYPRPGSPD